MELNEFIEYRMMGHELRTFPEPVVPIYGDTTLGDFSTASRRPDIWRPETVPETPLPSSV